MSRSALGPRRFRGVDQPCQILPGASELLRLPQIAVSQTLGEGLGKGNSLEPTCGAVQGSPQQTSAQQGWQGLRAEPVQEALPGEQQSFNSNPEL